MLCTMILMDFMKQETEDTTRFINQTRVTLPFLVNEYWKVFRDFS